MRTICTHNGCPLRQHPAKDKWPARLTEGPAQAMCDHAIVPGGIDRAPTGPGVMIEKSATSLWAGPGGGFLELNHTRIIDLLVSFRSRNSFPARRARRRISRSGH